MKTSIAALGLGVMLAAASASAQLPVVGGPTNVQVTVEAIDARFGSGTEYAATLAAREFLKLLYDVPAEQIGANKHGWVVQTHSCRGL